LAGSLLLGYYQPISLSWVGDAAAQKTAWFALVMGYCIAAAVLPVWLLLQPRDYLSSAFTFGGLLLAFVALFAAFLPIGPENAPAFVGFSSSKGPLWPMLFILVACGACSGFHGLVASGTTVKQLPSERHGLSIGYGSMMVEAALAVQVTLLAAAGLYWAGEHSAAGVTLVVPQIVKAEGADWPSVAFARSFANVVSTGLPFIGFQLAMMFAGMALNATLLDTLDATTRLARFILSESIGQRVKILAGRWPSTLATVGGATILGLTGGADVLWPVFGAANQLIAALTLVVVSLYLLGVRRPSLYAAIPAAFMLVTTVGALLYQAYGFAFGETPRLGLAGLSLVLASIGVYVAGEAIPKAARMLVSSAHYSKSPAQAQSDR
jgi:carbon starvation protein